MIDALTLYTVENGMLTWYVSYFLCELELISLAGFSIATALSLFFVRPVTTSVVNSL